MADILGKLILHASDAISQFRRGTVLTHNPTKCNSSPMELLHSSIITKQWRKQHIRMAILNQICSHWKGKLQFDGGGKPTQYKWNAYLFSKLKFRVSTARQELLTCSETLAIFPQVRVELSWGAGSKHHLPVKHYAVILCGISSRSSS